MEEIKSKTYFQKRNNFSELHYQLPKSYGMFDIDIMKGEWLQLSEIESTKENATYIEYRCLKFDKDESRFNEDRIKFVALFELKFTGTDSLKENMNLNSGTPLWAVFMLAKKLEIRFFLVVATQGREPFYFFEYDIKTNIRKEYKTLIYSNDPAVAINDFWKNELQI